MRFHWRNIPSWNKVFRPNLFVNDFNQCWDYQQVLLSDGVTYADFIPHKPSDWSGLFPT
jgi:hypothetical protein